MSRFFFLQYRPGRLNHGRSQTKYRLSIDHRLIFCQLALFPCTITVYSQSRDSYLWFGPDEEPFESWRKQQEFPSLPKLARKYFSTPCSSAYSERLFEIIFFQNGEYFGWKEIPTSSIKKWKVALYASQSEEGVSPMMINSGGSNFWWTVCWIVLPRFHSNMRNFHS